jgi:hypothetical protein
VPHIKKSNNGLATINIAPTIKNLSVVKLLEGRRLWLKGGGLSFEASQRNISILVESLSATVDEKPAEKSQSEFAPNFSYKPRTEALPHQQRAINHISSVTNSALFMRPGTGKTWVALTHAGKLFSSGEITACLVVSKKGPHKQWAVQQIPEHFGAPYDCYLWPQGPQRSLSGKIVFFCINVEALRVEGSKGFNAAASFINQHSGRVLFVFDESHQIKNHSSLSWKSSSKLGRLCSRRMILTGTPIAANLEDAWSQFKWLDESIIGIRYSSSFRNEYCVMGGFEGKQIVGSKNLERFMSLIEPYTFILAKDEIGLPPKTFVRWPFELSNYQSDQISSIKSEIKEALLSGDIERISSINPASAAMKVQQISNGFVYNEDGSANNFYTPTLNPRCKALIDVIECIEGPVIIWARFRKDITNIIQALSEEFPDQKSVSYYGGTEREEKERAVSDFLEGRARFFVANPASAGTGLNLQSGGCINAIYYSNSDNSIERWQSEDRIHRIGMSGTAQYWDLVANKGIDRAILARLQKKTSLSGAMLKEIYEEIEE